MLLPYLRGHCIPDKLLVKQFIIRLQERVALAVLTLHAQQNQTNHGLRLTAGDMVDAQLSFPSPGLLHLLTASQEVVLLVSLHAQKEEVLNSLLLPIVWHI